jgi:hypothetical protein
MRKKIANHKWDTETSLKQTYFKEIDRFGFNGIREH